MAKVTRRRRKTTATAADVAVTTAAARKNKTIELPLDDNVPPDALSQVISCIYGRKGIGKTSLGAMFPDALTFMFERGRRNLPIRQIPKAGEVALDWTRFTDYVEMFISSNYMTMIVDTVDRAYDRCMEAVCKRNGCTHPNQKNDYGDTWKQVSAEFDALFGMVQDSGKGLVFLSHEKPKPLTKRSKGMTREDSESEFEFERMEPSCSNQAFAVIQEICDYVFYYGFVDEFRTITVRSENDLCWTSCGIGGTFLNPDGSTINTFKVGTTPQEAYENLVGAFNNEGQDMDWKPPRKKKTKSLD